ncbi:MAG TPA: hypothetical protein VF252_08200 [Gemmatimonadales bacterium]
MPSVQVKRFVSAALLAGLVPVLGSAPGHTAPAVDPFVWGVQGHPGKQVAYAGSGNGLARQLAYVQRLGATHYRIDLYPDTAGRLDPDLQPILEAASSRNVVLLPVLVGYPDTAASLQANYRRGYAMGSSFAARYRGRFSHIEAGNELELTPLRFTVDSSVQPARIDHFEGSDLDNYVPHLLTRTTWFLRGMTDGIHHASPGTRVIINAGWRHYGFFEALRRDSVDFDVYGYHWYSEMGDFAAEALPHLPGDKEIWVTEANRRNTSLSYSDPVEQAAWIARFSRRMAAIPRVRALFIYELYDQPAVGATHPESYYGLVACSDETCTGPKRLKPAFHAYRDVIRAQR